MRVGSRNFIRGRRSMFLRRILRRCRSFRLTSSRIANFNFNFNFNFLTQSDFIFTSTQPNFTCILRISKSF